MSFFSIDPRKILLIGLIVIVPSLVINMQRKSEEPWYLRPFSLVTGMIQKSYSSLSSGVRGTTALYLDLIGIKKENRLLVKENAELRAQLGAMTELKKENQRLNRLLRFKQKSNMQLLAARVIGKDLLPDHNSITINRGSEHGVKQNMAALTVGGVVGYIYRVEPYTSQVLLLTDRYAAIDGLVQRSRARGIVEGFSKEICQMRYLKRGDDVEKGDLIVTSGLDNIFPKGFPVGEVLSVNKSRYGMSQKVRVLPAVDPLNLEELFVVIKTNQENLSPGDAS